MKLLQQVLLVLAWVSSAGSRVARSHSDLGLAVQDYQPSSAPEPIDLAADEDRLRRLHATDECGDYVIPDDVVRALETKVAHVLRVPSPWRVVLRDAQNPHLGLSPHEDFVNRSEYERGNIPGALSHAQGETLPLRFSLDGKWILFSGLLFIDPDSSNPFVQQQFLARSGFFPCRAVPVILESLSKQLETWRGKEYSLSGLDIESGKPQDSPPSARVSLTIESAARRFQAHLRGTVLFPPAAAQASDFKYTGRQGTADSIIGQDSGTDALAHKLDDALSLMEHCPTSDALSYRAVFSYGTDYRGLYTTLQRGQSSRYGSLSVGIRTIVTQTGELALGAVIGKATYSMPEFEKLLKQVVERTIDKDRDLFALVGGTSAREFHVLSCPPLHPTDKAIDPTQVFYERIVLDGEDSATRGQIEQLDFAVESYLSRRHFSFRPRERPPITIGVHETLYCLNGEDLSKLATYAELGDLRVPFVGGTIERLRDGP